MSSFLHQRPLHNILTDQYPLSPRSPQNSQKPSILFNRTSLVLLLSLLIVLGILYPWIQIPQGGLFSSSISSSRSGNPNFSESKWRAYTLSEAAANVAKNNTLIVCAVSEAYLPFLNNWLISIVRQKHHDQVLVIAEDYPTLFKVNQKWPGHAVLIPPALESQAAHKFGSQVVYFIHCWDDFDLKFFLLMLGFLDFWIWKLFLKFDLEVLNYTSIS